MENKAEWHGAPIPADKEQIALDELEKAQVELNG